MKQIEKGYRTKASQPGPQQPQAPTSFTGIIYTDVNQNVTNSPENVKKPEIPAE
jgi:hypothetical protein